MKIFLMKSESFLSFHWEIHNYSPQLFTSILSSKTSAVVKSGSAAVNGETESSQISLKYLHLVLKSNKFGTT